MQHHVKSSDRPKRSVGASAHDAGRQLRLAGSPHSGVPKFRESLKYEASERQIGDAREIAGKPKISRALVLELQAVATSPT